MEWLYRIFYKEEFEARWFTYPAYFLIVVGFWVGFGYVVVHFVRKYW